MADPTPLAVREAVKTIMETVSGIGTVTVYQGQIPPWERSQGARDEAFWEISIGAERRSQFASPRKMEREHIVVIVGRWPTGNMTEAEFDAREDDWDALWVGVLDALSDNRTLDDVTDHMTGLPDMVLNEVRPVVVRDSERLCFFCQIQLAVRSDTDYAAP
jgi:hypothetical protein